VSAPYPRCLDILSYILHECAAPGLLANIHHQGCLTTLCKDLQSATTELMPPGYMLELLLEVKFCLHAAASHCPELVASFAESNGYELIAEYVTLLDWAPEGEEIQRGSALLEIMLEFVFIGPREVEPSPASLVDCPFSPTIPAPAAPGTSDQGRRIRSLEALAPLQRLVLDEASPRELRFRCLHLLLDVYAAHRLNFFVLRNESSLLHQLDHLDAMDEEMQHLVLKFIEYAATVLNTVPTAEFRKLNQLLAAVPSSVETTSRILATIAKLVSFDVKFKKAVQAAGIFGTLLAHLYRYASKSLPAWVEAATGAEESTAGESSSQRQEESTVGIVTPETVPLVIDTTEALVANCPVCIDELRSYGVEGLIFRMLAYREGPHLRGSALRLLGTLLHSKPGNPVPSSPRRHPQPAVPESAVVASLARRMSHMSSDLKHDLLSFIARSCGGGNRNLRQSMVSARVGKHLIAQIDALSPTLQKEVSREGLSELEALVQTILVLVRHDCEARKGLERDALYETLESVAQGAGLLTGANFAWTLDLLVDVALERVTSEGGGVGAWSEAGPALFLRRPLVNPKAILVIFSLLPLMRPDEREKAMEMVAAMAEAGPVNANALCEVTCDATPSRCSPPSVVGLSNALYL